MTSISQRSVCLCSCPFLSLSLVVWTMKKIVEIVKMLDTHSLRRAVHESDERWRWGYGCLNTCDIWEAAMLREIPKEDEWERLWKGFRILLFVAIKPQSLSLPDTPLLSDLSCTLCQQADVTDLPFPANHNLCGLIDGISWPTISGALAFIPPPLFVVT